MYVLTYLLFLISSIYHCYFLAYQKGKEKAVDFILFYHYYS